MRRAPMARKRLMFDLDELPNTVMEAIVEDLSPAKEDAFARMAAAFDPPTLERSSYAGSPAGSRTPSPGNSPSKVPPTPTPAKTSRFRKNTPLRQLNFNDAERAEGFGPLISVVPPTPPEEPYKIVSKGESSPPTVSKIDAMDYVKTPMKPTVAASDLGFSMGAPKTPTRTRSNSNGGDNNGLSVTLSTNFNPFSPIRGVRNSMTIPTETNSNIPRFISDFEIEGELGRGSYGVVYKCINRTDGWVYAVKKVQHKNKQMRNHMLKEAFALAALGQHPHIVRYYGSWEVKATRSLSSGTRGQSVLYIQLEYCDGGSLANLISRNERLDECEIARVGQHIGKALQHMHAMSLAHGDVKPENIFRSGNLYKLGDLGQINSDGDGKYLAPELLQMDEDSEEDKAVDPVVLARADLFSLGLTLLDLAVASSTGHIFHGPRSTIGQEDIMLDTTKFSFSFIELLQALLRNDPLARPTAAQMLTHPLLLDEHELRIRDEQVKRVAVEEQLLKAQQQIQLLEAHVANLQHQYSRLNHPMKRQRSDSNLFESDSLPSPIASPFQSPLMSPKFAPSLSGANTPSRLYPNNH